MSYRGREQGRRPRPGTHRVSERQAGQSTIEFVLTLSLIMGFVLFMFQFSLFMAFGNYAQYATFMAARAYLAAGLNPQDQLNRAAAVMTSTVKSKNNPQLDRIPIVAKGMAIDGGGNCPPNSGALGVVGMNFNDSKCDSSVQNYSWMQGIRYGFKGKVFLMPVGQAITSQISTVQLISEAFLGRETSFTECQDEMKARGGVVFDNGC